MRKLGGNLFAFLVGVGVFSFWMQGNSSEQRDIISFLVGVFLQLFVIGMLIYYKITNNRLLALLKKHGIDAGKNG